MGKPTGFMEYARQENPIQAPGERLAHFGDFHGALPEEERRRQGGRCMECGVPFCQSGCSFGKGSFGCPLHNLIPEWNDMVCRGNGSHALARLLKTNNFPEFTGRVCPAPCEAACVCQIHGEAVSIRENELSIIESAFENGLMKPRKIPLRSGRRIAVVGSGPAGLAAADQLNHRGHSVTVFERDDRPGGLLMYGIPNMKLPKDVVLRRLELMEREGVQFRTGVDVGRGMGPEELLEEFDCVILCCGAGKARPYQVPGVDARGVLYALPYLKSAARALLDRAAPIYDALDRHVVVIGAGDTSADCVATALRQGCASLTQLIRKPREQVERAEGLWGDRPYVPDYAEAEAVARFGVSPRRYSTVAKELLRDENGAVHSVVTVQVAWHKGENGRMAMEELPGTEEAVPADLVLIASGFSGCEDYVPDSFGLDARDFGSGCVTANERVFVAGDMRTGSSLVVTAIADGRQAARLADSYLMRYVE